MLPLPGRGLRSVAGKPCRALRAAPAGQAAIPKAPSALPAAAEPAPTAIALALGCLPALPSPCAASPTQPLSPALAAPTSKPVSPALAKAALPTPKSPANRWVSAVQGSE